MTAHAQVVFDRFTNTTDTFPQAGTHTAFGTNYPTDADFAAAQQAFRKSRTNGTRWHT